jgi:hypothetical protein
MTRNAFLDAARAAAGTAESPAEAPSARGVRAPVYVHGVRARVIIPQEIVDKTKKLRGDGRTERRFSTKLAEFQTLLDKGQYRSFVLRAGALVAGELAKLEERDRDLAEGLCVKAGARMISLAIEITLIRLGALRAPEEASGD